MTLELKHRTYRSTRKVDRYKLVILFLFPILSYYGYKYNGFNLTAIKAMYFVSIPIMMAYVGRLWFSRNFYSVPHFTNMSLITASTLFSIFMSYAFWDQNIMLGYRVTAPFLSIVYYFYLMKTRPSLHIVETIIWLYTGIYILLWLYGTSQAPATIFGDPEDILDDSRGVFRLFIPGKAILVLCLFLSINKFVITHNNKFLFVALLLFTIIVAHVIRQVILLSFLVSIYYLLRNNTRVWLYMLLVGIASLMLIESVEIPQDSTIGNLVALTESQLDSQKSGEDNVRLREYMFFFNDYSKNFLTDVLGNGMPHANSDYGKFYVNIVQERYRYFLSDVGYAQMFVLTGWMGMGLYLVLFFKVSKQSVFSNIMFAKLFIIYQIFANVAASWYRHDVILIALCMYLLSMNDIKKSINEKSNRKFRKVYQI